jgi:hypothetical protein
MCHVFIEVKAYGAAYYFFGRRFRVALFVLRVAICSNQLVATSSGLYFPKHVEPTRRKKRQRGYNKKNEHHGVRRGGNLLDAAQEFSGLDAFIVPRDRGG